MPERPQDVLVDADDRPQFRGRLLAGLVLCGVAGLVWFAVKAMPRRDSDTERLTARSSDEELSAAAGRPVEVREDGFVSSRECRECHRSHYKSWHASYHRTMTQLASSESIVADFNKVILNNHGQSYRLSRNGGECFVTIQGRTRAVVMTTGSHHMQVCWLSAGQARALEILPFTYLISSNRWVPRDATFLKPPNEQPEPSVGRWNVTCIACHATHGQPRILDDRMESVVAEFGISCEACHGPGERHVRLMRNSDKKQADLAIVQPQSLSHVRQAQVCGQCHGAINDRPGNIEKFLVHGPLYRAGDDLEKHRHYIAKPEDQFRFWSDGMVRVTGAEYNGLLESPCYQRGEMTCLSCHQLHKSTDDPRSLKHWANDQLGTGMRSDRACLQCHDAFADDATLRAHTHHRSGSSGSSCYECHMSHTTFGLLKAIRSHTISSPSVLSTKRTGRPNACNLCHSDKTLAWTAEHLHSWYDAPVPELTSEERLIADSLLQLLQGDAGQRALAAWNMGRAPAVAVSGSDWPAPFLSQLLADPYDAVRFVAGESLRRLPGYDEFSYDFVGSDEDRQKAVQRAMDIWRRLPASRKLSVRKAVLIDGPGQVDETTMRQLIRERDDRPIRLLQ